MPPSTPEPPPGRDPARPRRQNVSLLGLRRDPPARGHGASRRLAAARSGRGRSSSAAAEPTVLGAAAMAARRRPRRRLPPRRPTPTSGRPATCCRTSRGQRAVRRPWLRLRAGARSVDPGSRVPTSRCATSRCPSRARHRAERVPALAPPAVRVLAADARLGRPADGVEPLRRPWVAGR